MDSIELKRGENVVIFDSNIFLAQREKNIKPFRRLCQEYGAVAVFSSIIKKKKDIEFEGEQIIACLESDKLIINLEKDDCVKAYCIENDSPYLDSVIKKTKKPIIISINNGKNVDNLKYASGILINSMEGEKEITFDYRLAEEISKKYDVPIISRSKIETPEEIYGIIKKTQSKGIAIGDIAFRQPVIFEQTVNYFEKGYYNKITRKRREKTVELFTQLYSEMEKTSPSELNKFKETFMND